MNKMTLKEIQQTELEIMIQFDKIARKYGLKYSLCAGTLLGAVRHQGFIPWDDDIDVSMPRPDYEKLIRLNRKQKLWPAHLHLSSFEDGTLDSPYCKLFDSRTKIVEHNYTQKDVSSLWIDIFPVDGLPADVKKKKSHYRWAMTLCRMNVAAVVKNGYGSSRLVILIKDIFMKPFAKLVGRRRIAKSQRKHALKYRYGKAPECGMVTWAYDGPGQALTVSEYETLVELPFEGHSFFAMSAWDKNLSGIFGDYMQLPPEEDRITHELEAYRV
ncbi:MAG: LicD family protein [Parasporobacterium sp.]|nr:LicD family protein [Parasporobacterium sp.]